MIEYTRVTVADIHEFLVYKLYQVIKHTFCVRFVDIDAFNGGGGAKSPKFSLTNFMDSP
jgi:hypothetical protein